MKFNLKKEIIVMIIALIPLAYLLIIWNSLPEIIPVHWNYKGEVDEVGSKSSLLLIPFLLPILTYLILTVIPFIDPKKKLENMGNTLHRIKFVLTLFMAILALFIIYSSKAGTFMNPNTIFILMGVLFMIFGNYFKVIKPNYFIGIRTPWTVNDDYNWKLTHRFSSGLWMIGGLIIVISGFLFSNKINFILFLIMTGVLAIIPFIYSYKLFRDASRMVD